MAQRPTIETTYGTVDRSVLDELRQTLDTNKILTAIEIVDRSAASPDERGRLAASLRCLHGMARHLVDTAPATIVSEQPIWQLAEEILDDLEASSVEFSGIAAIVDRIASLRPNDE
jgi:hypothetical protein